jgi:ADP-ribose pyrophosphatase YjhB (NUDIX family)
MTEWRIRLSPILTPMYRQWWRLRRGMTLGVRGIACDGEGRVLLIRHTYSRGWHLPGGGVEAGQSALDAVTREMAEEGGVEAIAPPSLLGFYSNHAIHPNDHVALYRLESWRPCPPLENGEIAERGFFARDALPTDLSSGARRRLAEVFDGAPMTGLW